MILFRIVFYSLFIFLFGLLLSGCNSINKKDNSIGVNNISHLNNVSKTGNYVGNNNLTISNSSSNMNPVDVVLKTEELSSNIDKSHEHIISFALSDCNSYDLMLSGGGVNLKKKIKAVPYLLTGLLENTKYVYSVLCNGKVLIKGEFYTDKENKKGNTFANKYDTKPLFEKKYLPKIDYAVFLGKYLKIGFDKPVLIKKLFIYKYKNGKLKEILSGDAVDSVYDCLDSITGIDINYDSEPILQLFKDYGTGLISQSLSGECIDLFNKLYFYSQNITGSYKILNSISYTGNIDLLNYTFPLLGSLLTGRYKIKAEYKYQDLTGESIYYIYNY